MTLFMVFLYERHISLGQMELLCPHQFSRRFGGRWVCASHVVDIFVKICLQAQISNSEFAIRYLCVHICFSDFVWLAVKVDKRNEFVIEFSHMFSKSPRADATSHI